MIVLVGAGGARADAGRAAPCCSRTRCSRPRCSWSSASSTTPPAPATSAALPASAGGCPVIAAVAALAAALMAALPPFLGFVAKEADLETVCWRRCMPGRGCCSLVVVVGSVFTIVYSAALPVGRVRPGRQPGAGPAPRVGRRCTRRRRVPGAAPRPGRARACCSVSCPPCRTAGRRRWTTYGDECRRSRLRPGAVARPRRRRCCCRPSYRAAAPSLFLARDRVARWQRLVPAVPTDGCLRAVMRGLTRARPRSTGQTQRGSIPATQRHPVSPWSSSPACALVASGGPSIAGRIWDSSLQLVMALMVLAALAATVMRNRFAAVLLVGVIGYGFGAIFVFHGAPDLALTQFLVETLALVVFVLVLPPPPRGVLEAPSTAAPRWCRGGRRRRGGLRVATRRRHRTLRRRRAVDRPRSCRDSLPERPRRERRERDPRRLPGLDTLGEITVLLVAAMGVVGLAGPARAATIAHRWRGRPRRRRRDDARACASRHHVADRRDPSTRDRSCSSRRPGRVPRLLVVSVYLLFAGHNAPGGGFVGGLVAARRSRCGWRPTARRAAQSFRLPPDGCSVPAGPVASLTASAAFSTVARCSTTAT